MRRVSSSVKRSRRRRAALAAAATAGILAVAVPTLSWAHAVVFPRQSTTGGYEKYVLRVPNEKAVATTRVEIHFPAGLRVTSFADVPGWQLEVVTDSAKAITAAIWTGNLPPQRFVEFPFVAANPKTDTKLGGGLSDLRRRRTGRMDRAEGSKRPASVTMIGAPTASSGGSDGFVRWLPWRPRSAAVSLGLAMRRPEARSADDDAAPARQHLGRGQRTTIVPFMFG
jgi:hypothetical protein